MLCVLLGQKVK